MDYGELLQGRDPLSNNLGRLRGLEQYRRGAAPRILVLQQEPVNRPVDLRVQSAGYKVQEYKEDYGQSLVPRPYILILLE